MFTCTIIRSLLYTFSYSCVKRYVILQNSTSLTNEFNNILFTDLPNGWPALQIRLLNELVYTARRLGDPSLAVRYDPSCVTVVAGATCMQKLDYMHLEEFNHGILTYYKLFDMIGFFDFQFSDFFWHMFFSGLLVQQIFVCPSFTHCMYCIDFVLMFNMNITVPLYAPSHLYSK